MVTEVKKMRYFNNLFLKQEEFILEQNYHVKMRQIHNRYFHTPGIVWGLNVSQGSQPDTIKVSPGMAVNKLVIDAVNQDEIGQEIILAQDTEKPLSSFKAGDVVYIYIKYDEEAVDIVKDRGGETEKIHILEKAAIGMLLAPVIPDGAQQIPLAKVILKDSGGKAVVGEIDNSVRIYSGAVGKLQLPAAGSSINAPIIEGKNINGVNGIQVTSPQTNFEGSVSVKQNCNVLGNFSVTGHLNVQGTITTVNSQNLNIDDNIITVNNYAASAVPKNVNGGLEVFRGGTAPNAQIIWDEAKKKWTIGVAGQLADIVTANNLPSIPADIAATIQNLQNTNQELNQKIINLNNTVSDLNRRVSLLEDLADKIKKELWPRVIKVDDEVWPRITNIETNLWPKVDSFEPRIKYIENETVPKISNLENNINNSVWPKITSMENNFEPRLKTIENETVSKVKTMENSFETRIKNVEESVRKIPIRPS